MVNETSRLETMKFWKLISEDFLCNIDDILCELIARLEYTAVRLIQTQVLNPPFSNWVWTVIVYFNDA